LSSEGRVGVNSNALLQLQLSTPNQIRSFGEALEPRWIFGARPLDQ